MIEVKQLAQNTTQICTNTKKTDNKESEKNETQLL